MAAPHSVCSSFDKYPALYLHMNVVVCFSESVFAITIYCMYVGFHSQYMPLTIIDDTFIFHGKSGGDPRERGSQRN